MKKIAVLLFSCAITQALYAQKCLDINIVSLMGQLQAPGSSATCYANCVTSKNDEGQTVINGYGTAYDQLDAMVKTNTLAFNQGAVTGAASMPGMLNMTDPSQAQALAAKFQSMTEDEKKAYALQMAQQMQAQYSNPASSAMAESPRTSMQVMKAQNIATTQLSPLTNELAAKYRDLQAKEDADKAAIPQPDYSSCPPVDKVGMPSCSCTNGIAAAYWQKVIAVVDSYNEQKAALLESYIVRIKGLVGQIEDIIAQLHQGDDVKTAMYKRTLFSAQSSAFGNAFGVTGTIVQDIQKNGSDVYVNKVNADARKYMLGCSRDGK